MRTRKYKVDSQDESGSAIEAERKIGPGGSPVEIIDFHAHIYPDKIAEKASQATGDFYGITPAYSGTSKELLTSGKAAGISRFVLLPVATKPDQVSHINDFIADEVSAHNEFYGFGTLHPDCENILEETDHIISLGLKGIKLHPDTQQFNTDDKRLFEVFDYIQGKIPLLVHCGDKRFDFSHPRRLKNVIDNFPHLQVIAAHLGGWSLFDEAFELLKDENCYLDISSTMMFLPPEQIEHYIHGYGVERILFGTDFPLWRPEQEVASFRRLNLSSFEFERIAYKNALGILET
ncbi:MAG: amidohydrolase family protein [Clostridia bacterium]|nr:amidohydrolase family protein [Clostridia bacterium]